MQNNNGAISFQALLDTRDFDRGRSRIESQLRNLGNTAETEAGRFDSAFKNAGLAIGSYFTFTAAKSLISDIVKVRGEFQQLGVALETMLGSKEKADKMMSDVVSLAAVTPFSVQEVAQGTKQLLAYGIANEDVIDTLTRLGNIASGLSIPLSRLQLVYGQVLAKGKLMGDDLRQFTETGIPLVSKLAEQFNVTKAAIYGMVSEGKIGFEDVKKVLFDMTNEGGAFFNLMEKQSKTVTGQISNLGDAFDRMLNSIGEANEGVINSGIAGLASIVENYEQVGKILVALVATYGTYRAAVMLTTAITAASATASIAAAAARQTEIASRLALIDVTIAERAATLAGIEAKVADSVATEAQLRSEIALLAEKEYAAIATTKLTAVTLAEAEAKVLSLASSTRLSASTLREVAAKELSAATLAHETAVRNANSLSQDVNTRTNLVSTQAKVTNTLATEVNVAATNLSTLAREREAAATLAATIPVRSMTAAQALSTIATRAATAANSFLNATMLANPYVLVATAVVGVTVAIWALNDGTTAQEKAQKALNIALDEAKQKGDTFKSGVTSLTATIRDNTETVYNQLKAYRELINQLPALQKFSQLDLQAMSGEDLSLLLNTAINTKEIEDGTKSLQYYKQALIDVQREANLQTDGSPVTEDIKKSNKELDSWKTSYQDVLAYIKAQIVELETQNELHKEASELEAATAKGAAALLAYHEKNRQKLFEQKDQLATLLSLTNQAGQSFGIWNNELSLTSNLLNSVINKIAKSQSAIDLLKSKNPNSQPETVQNKAYYELQKSTAEGNLAALGVSKRGSKEWNEYAAQIREADKALSAYNTTVNKEKAPKKGKQEESFLDGSLAYYEKEISKVSEKLKRLPTDNLSAISALNEQLIDLTAKREAAQKAIEIRSWSETLESKRKLYEEYEAFLANADTSIGAAAVDVIALENAKIAYSGLLEQGQNYKQFLENQLAPLQSKVLSNEASQEEMSRFLILTKELNEVLGVSSPMERFNKRLEGIKENAGSTADVIRDLAKVKAELDAVPSDEQGSNYFNQVKAIIAAQKAANDQAANDLKAYLLQVQGSKEKELAIVKKYEGLIKQAQKDGRDTSGIDKEYNEAMAENYAQGLEAYSAMNELMGASDLKRLKEQETLIKQIIQNLIDEGFGSSEQLKKLQDELNKNLNSQADKSYQNIQMWSNAIGQAGQELSQLEGVLGNIGQLFVSAAQSAQQFANTYGEIKANGGKNTAQSYSNAAAAGVNLIGLVIGAAQKRKAKKKEEAYNTVQAQLDLNKALIEEIRLRTELNENVYVTDYYGRITDSINAMQQASGKAFESLAKLSEIGQAKNGTKNKIDWGAVGTGAGAGATIGASVGSAAAGVGAAPGAVIGAIAGGLIGLFGAMKTDSRFSGLFELYPELISQSGEFNGTLAETLIANDQLDDATKQQLQNVIDLNEEWKAAKEQIKDIVGELTGQMGGQLRDALVGAFEDGTDAAYAFSQVVEDTISNAIQQLIYSKVFGQLFDSLGSDLENALAYFSLSNGDTSGLLDSFAKFSEAAPEAMAAFNAAMQAAKDAGAGFGFDLFNNEDDRSSGMTGAVKSITEETAGVLAGNITQIRIKQAESNELVRQQLFYLANISSNSNYLSKLDRMDRNLNTLAGGSNSRDFGSQ